jgi:hypothetical protein
MSLYNNLDSYWFLMYTINNRKINDKI